VLVSLSVGESLQVLKELELETGLLYDERGMFSTIISLIEEESSAEVKVRQWVERQLDMNCGYGRCYETQEMLKCFSWLSELLLWQLRRDHLYEHGMLPYALDHMRSSVLVLRRLDSIYDIIKREFSSP